VGAVELQQPRKAGIASLTVEVLFEKKNGETAHPGASCKRIRIKDLVNEYFATVVNPGVNSRGFL
jgi:hypothetical protein